ncbi:hypothetical protein CBS101457_006559 [Exobasidium rhododendri]|nr:hypothetical protein CBS101457_006559 [Exobasidium rhododendri]
MQSPFTESGMPDNHSPSNQERGSSSDLTSPSVDRRSQTRKRDAPSDWDSDRRYVGHLSMPSPSILHSGNSFPRQPSRFRADCTSAMLPPPPLSMALVDQDQILPSPILSHVPVNTASIYINGYATGPRWMMGNTTNYANATLTIGRDDPRMNAISIGLVWMDRARALFKYFAEKLQPHSFGFPTYPASEQLTPVIISSILMVAALYDPQSRQHHQALKYDCMASIKPEQDVNAAQSLDPELGIGVEEIIGACIASIWLGGETGWRISRVAQWWATEYLKHFEIPSRNVTLGECLTILPPFRQIDLVDKLRIWLSAYIAEAQQAFLVDRPSWAPDQSPAQYVDALRLAFSEAPLPSSRSDSANVDTKDIYMGGFEGSTKFPPPPDRQLMGHASILHILLGAQRTQREARRNAEAIAVSVTNTAFHAQSSPQFDGRRDSMISKRSVQECVTRLTTCWKSWMNEIGAWKASISSIEDLSSSTSSAMDLTLTCYLAKSHLGSLALDPEYGTSIAVSKAASKETALLQVQAEIVNIAKVNALAALQLATSQVGFRDRLLHLPNLYHFLLGHAAGFLLLLIQRKYRFMLAGEAKGVLETVENFVQIYVSDIATHNFHPHASTSPHPALATAEALSRSCQHLRSQARGK